MNNSIEEKDKSKIDYQSILVDFIWNVNKEMKNCSQRIYDEMYIALGDIEGINNAEAAIARMRTFCECYSNLCATLRKALMK